jgi:hypothetical protein
MTTEQDHWIFLLEVESEPGLALVRDNRQVLFCGMWLYQGEWNSMAAQCLGRRILDYVQAQYPVEYALGQLLGSLP